MSIIHSDYTPEDSVFVRAPVRTRVNGFNIEGDCFSLPSRAADGPAANADTFHRYPIDERVDREESFLLAAYHHSYDILGKSCSSTNESRYVCEEARIA